MPPVLLGFFIGGAVFGIVGITAGYRWGRATTRWQDWQNTKKGLPAMRKLAFRLVGKAFNPTFLLAAVIVVFSCVVYVQSVMDR